MLVPDTPHGMPDRARHTGSGALGRGTDAAIASSESDGAGQFACEEVAFGLRLRHPRSIPKGSRLLQIVLNLCEPPAVRVLRAGVEHLAGIARISKSQAGFRNIGRVSRTTLLDASEIHDVELPSRIGEQSGEVPYAPSIAQAYDLSLENHHPVLAFAPEDRVGISVRSAGRSWSGL
jgi:hypothetical protein